MKATMLEPITYHLHSMPVSARWSLAVNIPRDVLGSTCEALHGIAHAGDGAAIYYPDLLKKQTLCRYEWPINWQQTFPRFHLVVSLMAGSSDIQNLDCYLVDTAEKGEAPFTGRLLSTLIKYAQAESMRAVEEAINQLSEEQAVDTNVVFYLDLGSFDPVLENIETHDNKYRLIQTRVLKDHKRISVISVSATEKNQEMAKASALRDIAAFTALLTLGAGSLIKTTSIDWDKKTPAPQFIDKERKYQTRTFYPKSAKKFKHGNNSARLNAAVIFPWKAYQELSDGDQTLFLNSVIAYQTAKELTHTQSTLSVVAYIASLSAISKSAKKQCKGSITCSECGDLDFRHDLVGDQRAVIKTVSSLLNIDDGTDEYVDLKKVIGRVYREQRSAYVHAATLRHNEYYQKLAAPTALPTNAKHVSDAFLYGRDLDSLESLVRQTLLRWLAQKSKIELPDKDLGISDIKIERKTGFQSSFRVPPRRIVSLRFT